MLPPRLLAVELIKTEAILATENYSCISFSISEVKDSASTAYRRIIRDSLETEDKEAFTEYTMNDTLRSCRLGSFKCN